MVELVQKLAMLACVLCSINISSLLSSETLSPSDSLWVMEAKKCSVCKFLLCLGCQIAAAALPSPGEGLS